LARNRERIRERRKQLVNYKKELECQRCGYDDHRALEFHHHNDDKSKSVSRMVGEGYSWEIIKKEIDKCEVLCSCCHRIEHWKD